MKNHADPTPWTSRGIQGLLETALEQRIRGTQGLSPSTLPGQLCLSNGFVLNVFSISCPEHRLYPLVENHGHGWKIREIIEINRGCWENH